MTARKPPPGSVAIAPLPKAVAYPPDSIWRTWQEGEPTLFRGNMFERRGQRVTRIVDSRPRNGT